MNDKPNQEPDDEMLLAHLADMLDATEPLREELVDLVTTETFAMRNIDAELAELVHDSAAMADGTRGDGTPRSISFTANGVDIEVQFSDETHVFGRIEPPGSECTLHGADGEQPLSLDQYGRFTTGAVGERMRLVVKLNDGRRVATPWIFR